MFFKTCGKYITYFLIAKKYFSPALSFYFRYTYTIGSAKFQQSFSKVSAKYKRLITIKNRKIIKKSSYFKEKYYLCTMIQKTIQILNKRAKFEYEILDKYQAGIVLVGTEIKSIRLGKASIAESFCEFNEREELFVINMTIEAYDFGTYYNHRPKSERKLLLQKKELRKLNKEVKNSGLTIVPLRLFINDKGLAKVDIALVRGKKLYDKRETIKDRDNKRNLDRLMKK